MSFPKRGDIYWTRFDPVVGSEQGGTRPAVVLQNDVGNRFSPAVIVAALTSQFPRKRYPFLAELPPGTTPRPSLVNGCQIRTVDKSRLSGEPIGSLDADTMRAVDEALRASLGLY